MLVVGVVEEGGGGEGAVDVFVDLGEYWVGLVMEGNGGYGG